MCFWCHKHHESQDPPPSGPSVRDLGSARVRDTRYCPRRSPVKRFLSSVEETTALHSSLRSCQTRTHTGSRIDESPLTPRRVTTLRVDTSLDYPEMVRDGGPTGIGYPVSRVEMTGIEGPDLLLSHHPSLPRFLLRRYSTLRITLPDGQGVR